MRNAMLLVVLAVLVGCGGSVEGVQGVEADTSPPCVTSSRVGVATILEYVTPSGPVTVACFDDPAEDDAGPCDGCGLDNGKHTTIATWGADGYCKNTASAWAACLAPSCIQGPEEVCQ